MTEFGASTERHEELPRAEHVTSGDSTSAAPAQPCEIVTTVLRWVFPSTITKPSGPAIERSLQEV